MGSREGMGRRLPSKEEEEDDEELRDGIIIQRDKAMYQNTLRTPQSNSISSSRRRKGTPHRAPLGAP